MGSHDLVAEYVRPLRAMTFDDLCDLLDLGIPIQAVTAVCPVPCPIRLTDDAHYEPDAEGDPAYLFPVTVIDPAWPWSLEAINPREELMCGAAIVDLIAFHPLTSRHALRTGDAIALGAIDLQHWDPEPVRVHRTVNAFLRAGCTGIVLLTSDPYEASRVLREIAIIEAEDEEHAALLHRLLHLPQPTTSIITIAEPASG